MSFKHLTRALLNGCSVQIFRPQHFLTMMKKLLTLLAGLSFAVGKRVIICPNSPFKATAGYDVTISCYVAPSVNLSAETFDFKRDDVNKTVVHSYRHHRDNHQEQALQYKNRTTLNHVDLGGGHLTLTISSVQLSDSGPYKLIVSGYDILVIHLEVAERDNRTMKTDSSTTGPPEEDVTEPENHDAVIGAVCGVCGVIGVAVAAAVIGFLVKSGKTRMCVKKLRGTTGEERETMNNNYEMNNLMNTTREGDGDQRSAAEDNLTEVVVDNGPSAS